MIRALVLLAFLFLPALAQARVLDIQEIKTPKGLTLWLVEDHTLPVLAISFAFRSGAAGDVPDKQGVTQLLSNTMDEGAGDLGSEAFQSALRDRAIDLSFSSSRDAFSGSVRTLLRHREEALHLLRLSLTAPRFDPEPVERMKQANLARIRSALNDPDWMAARILNDRIYAGHAYALNTGGTLASMSALAPDDLRAAYKRHIARDRLVVGIAGDITRDDAVKLVDDVFGALPARSMVPAIADADMPKAGKPVFYERAQPQTVLAMAWPGVAVDDPDYYAAQVLNHIFGGGGFSSRLMTEVREARGLTYGIYSSIWNLDHADRMVVQGSMQPQNVRATIDLVKSLAADMVARDVDADALQAAKDYLTGSLPLHFSSSTRIAGTLVSLQLDGRPVTALDDYREKISAVGAADIRRVAARIFATDPLIVMVGARPDGVDAETVTVLPNAEGKGQGK